MFLMSVYEILKESILSKQPCRISKSDQMERKVCPYLIGKSSAGEINVLYYQYQGYSKRGLQPDGSSANWRCNRISDIAIAEIIDEAWRQPIEKPRTRGSCIALPDVEVKDYY